MTLNVKHIYGYEQKLHRNNLLHFLHIIMELRSSVDVLFQLIITYYNVRLKT